MFLLNERLIAATLSILSFIISFATCMYHSVSLQAALLRSTICAFIFMFLGLLFGKIIKSIVIEAFVEQEKKEESIKAENEEKKEEEEEEETSQI